MGRKSKRGGNGASGKNREGDVAMTGDGGGGCGGGKVVAARGTMGKHEVGGVAAGGGKGKGKLSLGGGEEEGGRIEVDPSAVVELGGGEEFWPVLRPEGEVGEDCRGETSYGPQGVCQFVSSGLGLPCQPARVTGEPGSEFVARPPGVCENASAGLARCCQIVSKTAEPTSEGAACPPGVCGNASARLATSCQPSSGGAEAASEGVGTSATPSTGHVGFSPSTSEFLHGFVPPASTPKGSLPNAWTVERCREIVFSNNKAEYIAADGMTVLLDRSDVDLCEARLECALVGRVLGRSMPFDLLSREVKQMWSKFGQFQLSSFGPDCFFCFFGSKEVRDVILRGGSWIVGNQLIEVNKWAATFEPSSVLEIELLTSPRKTGLQGKV